MRNTYFLKRFYEDLVQNILQRTGIPQWRVRVLFIKKIGQQQTLGQKLTVVNQSRHFARWEFV